MRFQYEYQPECRSLCNLDGTQSAQCWASWHSGLYILGDKAALNISDRSQILEGNTVVQLQLKTTISTTKKRQINEYIC